MKLFMFEIKFKLSRSNVTKLLYFGAKPADVTILDK